MYKLITFMQLCLIGILQIATDCMLVGSLIQEHGLREYHIGFAAMVACSAVLTRLSWREWRKECER